MNTRAKKRLMLLLVLILKELLQKIAGARSDGNELERTVGGFQVKVHNSVEMFICESASSFLDDSLPHT